MNTFKKYRTQSKTFDHGQKIFELPDGLGTKVFLKKCQTIPFFSIFQTEAGKNKFVSTVKNIDYENKLKIRQH